MTEAERDVTQTDDVPNGIDAMVDAMRRMICLGDPTKAMLMHETKLAAHFRVSRTPVRQALQRLAYERLVETRTGIGTSVTPLHPAQAPAHLALLRGILRLAIELGPAPAVTEDVTPPPRDPPRTPNALLSAVFDHRAAILRMAGSLMVDPILQESHAAAHWRMVRWHVAAARAAPEAALEAALALRHAISAARTGPAILRLIAAEPGL